MCLPLGTLTGAFGSEYCTEEIYELGKIPRIDNTHLLSVMKLADVLKDALRVELAARSVRRVEDVHRAHVVVPVAQLRRRV